MLHGQVMALYEINNEIKTQPITIPMDIDACKDIINVLESFNEAYGVENIKVKYVIWDYSPEDKVILSS